MIVTIIHQICLYCLFLYSDSVSGETKYMLKIDHVQIGGGKKLISPKSRDLTRARARIFWEVFHRAA